jgi:hypothetical protein
MTINQARATMGYPPIAHGDEENLDPGHAVMLASTSLSLRPWPRTAFWFGDTVYLKVRSERLKGMITGILVRPGYLSYAVTWATGAENYHLEMELTSEFEPDFSEGQAGLTT